MGSPTRHKTGDCTQAFMQQTVSVIQCAYATNHDGRAVKSSTSKAVRKLEENFEKKSFACTGNMLISMCLRPVLIVLALFFSSKVGVE